MEISIDELRALICNVTTAPIDSGLVGRYVIVRCRPVPVPVK